MTALAVGVGVAVSVELVEDKELEKSKTPYPNELLMTASASANARECSKRFMPVSACGLCPCKAHDTVSIKWLTQRLRNNGHSTEDEPTMLDDASEGTILALIHDCSSLSQNKSAELNLNSNPPSPI